jgi:hypothetical protein
MFGLLMGVLSLLVPVIGMVPIFVVATLVGYGYEMINFGHLHWWIFPDDRFLIFKGKQACAWAVGCLWGGVPILAHVASA